MFKLVGFVSLAGVASLTTLATIGCSSAAPASTDADGGSSNPDSGAPVVIQCTAPTGSPITHTGEIKSDESWSADSVHLVPNDLNVLANVTIAPCAQVQIGASVTITVGAGDSIRGEGTAPQPITISAQDPAKPWSTIRTIGGTVRLAHATVTGGGQPASNAVPNTVGVFYGRTSGNTGAVTTAFSFDTVTIDGSNSDGVVLNDVDFDPASTDLTIQNVKEFPIRITAPNAGTVPSGSYVTGNGAGGSTPLILVMGGATETIVKDTTIHDRGVPYQVGDGKGGADLRVGHGSGPLATLTVEPNVTLAFRKGGGLFVEFASTGNAATGALVAKGDAGHFVTFTSAEDPPAPGDWVGIAFNSIPAPNDALDYVLVDYAGGDASTIGGCPLNTEVKAAVLVLSAAPATGFLTNSVIQDSARDGTFRGWIGSDVDFDATNTFTNVPGCHETNVLVAQGTCPTSACPQ